MFKGRLFLVFLLFALGAFSFYISYIGFRDARFPYNSLLVERSTVEKVTFYEKDSENENEKCMIDLSSGKQIVLFEYADNPSREKIEAISEGDSVICRYKMVFLQKEMIFSPSELVVSGKKLIDYRTRQDSDLQFAKKLMYFGILVSTMSLYLLFAIFYVLWKRRSGGMVNGALWKVGSWLLK